MQKELNTKIRIKEWSVKLRVSPEEEQQIKMGAIKMRMGIASYIKQAALEKFAYENQSSPKKLN